MHISHLIGLLFGTIPTSRTINSLWPNEAIWWHRSWSTLVQVMTWCCQAPSHHLNQCWLIIKAAMWKSPDVTESMPHLVAFRRLFVLFSWWFDFFCDFSGRYPCQWHSSAWRKDGRVAWCLGGDKFPAGASSDDTVLCAAGGRGHVLSTGPALQIDLWPPRGPWQDSCFRHQWQ